MTTSANPNCQQCGGSGYIQCWICNGSGRCTNLYIHTDFFGGKSTRYCQNGLCPRCNGTGTDDAIIFSSRCIMCNGSKVCPNCRGTSKCSTCGGTGKVACQACTGMVQSRG